MIYDEDLMKKVENFTANHGSDDEPDSFCEWCMVEFAEQVITDVEQRIAGDLLHILCNNDDQGILEKTSSLMTHLQRNQKRF